MLSLYSSLHFGGSTLAMGVIDKYGYFACSDFGIYATDSNLKTYLDTSIMFKDAQKAHKYSKTHSISKDGFIAMPYPKSSQIAVYQANQTTYTLKATLNWHKAYITHTEFGNEILCSGGEDGKVFVYQKPTFEILSMLPPMPDYISDISIDSNDRFISYSGYNCATFVYDSYVDKIIGEFKTQGVVEDSVFLPSNKEIFFICRNGDYGIYDLDKKSIKQKSHIRDAWLSVVELSIDRNFAFVLGRDSNFYIIRLSDCVLMDTLDIGIDGGSSIKNINDLLVVGVSDGDAKIYNLTYNIDEFLSHVKNGALNKALDLANESNKLLKTLKIYEDTIESKWSEVLKEATFLISKSQFAQAVSLVSIFLEDPKKNKEFQFYMSKKEEIAELVDALQNKNFITAYRILEFNPELKKLDLYNQLEIEWDNYMNKLRDFMLVNPEKNKVVVITALKSLISIFSKRDFVGRFLKNLDQCVVANNYYKNKKFIEFFTLCEKYDFLKNMKIYKKLIAFFDTRLEEARNLESKKEYDKSIEIWTLLSRLAPYTTMAKEHIEQINAKKRFYEFYQKDMYLECLTLGLDTKNSDIKVLEEYSLIVRKIMENLKEALHLASQGNLELIHNMAQLYGKIDALKQKVYSMMKIAYLYEIRLAQYENLDNINWHATLKQFIEQFGKAELLEACTHPDTINAFKNINETQSSGEAIYQYKESILIKTKSNEEVLADKIKNPQSQNEKQKSQIDKSNASSTRQSLYKKD